MSAYDYPGGELALFAHARHWKRYFSRLLLPHLHGDVIEVGAGLGESTPFLQSDRVRSWLCLEPDASLAQALVARCASNPSAIRTRVQHGTLADLEPVPLADVILYIDVLEHIEDDRAELLRAATRLRPGGALIVLAPAHMALYSQFDRAIGHFRRYNRRMLRAVVPPAFVELRLFYLDTLGMLPPLLNRWCFRKAVPSLQDVRRWDCLLVPLSQRIDPLLRFSCGRSIVGIWHYQPGSMSPVPEAA